ncbi:thiamine phosphate synthase [Bermanella marisrubri]|uniref:Thiamine-phosphate synthase n=1 Tax=Bermanella marisrubri TaxID=207949 RepID=Q1MYG4_9GAMM|nr:thiamine phosphate synthase [Bermanella marisrubri]EAT10981.1 hypothetical protein RED65_02128 [Oceanobacter sp. RED65] [Bermanella marisrubri]QIZ83773.1 thiamine phosphate synthase [Bermanella marisrubri]
MNHETRPMVLCVSGIDAQGLSGYQADLRALEAMAVHGCLAATALTAQTQTGVNALNPVDIEVFQSQLDSIASEYQINVIKVGLVASEEQVDVLLNHPISQNAKIILDPILSATSGHFQNLATQLAIVKKLIERAYVVTPNWDEALLLSNADQNVIVEELANQVLALGCHSVYLKGGHTAQKNRDLFRQCNAELKDIGESFNLVGKRTQSFSARGTGCIIASSIAAALALGHRLEDAVVIAKMQMESAWDNEFELSSGQVALQPKSLFSGTSMIQYLPLIHGHRDLLDTHFLPCEPGLGLYPVVDRAEWLTRLLPLGIRIIQLRIKDLSGQALREEITRAIHISEDYGVQLFINDYWQLAIELGAYGVHLGQEDLLEADLKAIEQAGLRLGVSSHCYFEVARALTINPSYLAYGPIYHTDSKQMPWQPQGLQQLSFWKKNIQHIPMVAIGGIKLERISQVALTGVDSIAMISAITQAEDPELVTETMMKEMEL